MRRPFVRSAPFHHKHAFYNPYTAPQFISAEHDGQPINWRLGRLYDTSKYGPSAATR
ncbi:hypothetical protein [Streptomyces tsukubensis]|uniref:hypothetical protein n=1 Tax=Streptomyces tsukubensis TaxID=83656 RepID=UPI00344F5FA2